MTLVLGIAECGNGPNGKALGLCLCYCKACDPDNTPDKHCMRHFNFCHRKCGDAARRK